MVHYSDTCTPRLTGPNSKSNLALNKADKRLNGGLKSTKYIVKEGTQIDHT